MLFARKCNVIIMSTATSIFIHNVAIDIVLMLANPRNGVAGVLAQAKRLHKRRGAVSPTIY